MWQCLKNEAYLQQNVTDVIIAWTAFLNSVETPNVWLNFKDQAVHNSRLRIFPNDTPRNGSYSVLPTIQTPTDHIQRWSKPR